MSSNFSKNLTSSMGISLGGLEVVTDFLFTNPEFYENDLMDVKNKVFRQNVVKQTYEKPVRPKKTKEAILHKFSILQYKPVIQDDEVIESPTLVGDDTDFDFDFSEEPEVTLEEIEEDSEVLEANSLMQRLVNMDNISDSIVDDIDIDIDNDETDEFDIDIEETLDDFCEIEDNDIDSDFDIESDDELDIESDDELDIESDDELDIEDDIDIEDDVADFNDEELQILDNFENDFTPTTNSKSLNSNDETELDFEDEFEERLDANYEIDIEDEIDIDVDDIQDVELEEDNFELEEDSFELEEDNRVVSGVNKTTQSTDLDAHDNEELRIMQQRFAEMEKQLHELKNAAAKESTSNIKYDVNKVSATDNIDRLLDSPKNTKSNGNLDKYSQYSLMSVDALYSEVKAYMIKMGVRTRAVELTALNNKFGELNIRKLIQKSYLIKIGSKGVTVGR